MCKVIRFTNTRGRIIHFEIRVNTLIAAKVKRSHDFILSFSPNVIKNGLSANAFNDLFEEYDMFASQFAIGNTEEPHRFTNISMHIPTPIENGPKSIIVFDGNNELFRIFQDDRKILFFLLNKTIHIFILNEFRMVITEAINKLNQS